MKEHTQLSEKESLELITSMIEKVKGSYHDTGIIPLLWGSAISIASFVSYLQMEFDFSIGFDIWWLVLAAIIPHMIISIKEGRFQRVRKYEDDALDAVWLAYALSIFGLIAYQNIIPSATTALIQHEGWQMMRHFTDNSKPDQVLQPFAPSMYSLFLLLYAFPTLVTALTKKFRPMLLGAIITYILFIVSCFTASRYDMLCGAIAALACWFIPGIIIRRKYLAQRKNAHV